jgi:predicted nucleic acid-binding protein
VRGAVLVDTGPLVALLDPSDGARATCREAMDTLEDADLITTEAVVTEASYLLDFSVDAQAALQRLLHSGRIRVEPVAPAERPRLATLIEKYRTLPMDYADATLVLLAERLGTMRVFTLDRRGFSIYRVGRRRFQIIPG